MKIFSGSALVVGLMFCTGALNAQTDAGSATITEADVAGLPKKNVVKLSVTNLFFRNFDFQYERSATKRISLAMGVKFMPSGGVPLIGYFEDQFDAEAGGSLEIDRIKLSGFAFTPEVRFYLGKGYNRGFYLAPFFRYSSYNMDNFTVSFEGSTGQQEVVLDGAVNGTSVGLQIGSQFSLGKNLTLDWFILGPHVGTFNADFEGNYPTMNPIDQQKVRDVLDGIEMPDIFDLKIDHNVGPNRTTIDASGRKPGMRLGFSLGYRF